LRPLAACHIPELQRDAWIRSFLPPYEPFFFQGEPLVNRLLRAGMIVYTRSEFRESFPGFSLSYGHTYQIWGVPQDAYVWMSDAVQRSQIDAGLLQDILTCQVELHRGQVYDDAWCLRLQREQAVREQNYSNWSNIFRRHQIDDLASHFVLTHDGWSALPKSLQETWLLVWLNDQLVDDGVTPTNPHDIPIVASHQQLVMKYSGCFAEMGGANCFAAALAMATGELSRAENIINLWLHQGPFLRALHMEGYRPVREIYSVDKINEIEPLDVLVWSNSDGQLIHASFCVAPGYLFNKMGQSREQPWLLLQIEDIIDYDGVITAGGKLIIYRRCAYLQE
jgi:hypothetical protein